MIFSELKLRELAKLDKTISTDQILNAINSIGFEVEECKKFVDLEKIKFGYVEKVYKNPNADNLTVCEILFDDKKRIIQTTAKNVEPNKTVVAFVPGSRKNDITYSSKELKGIVSEGMLASLDELGFSLDCVEKKWYDTIYLIDQKIDLKINPVEYFKLNDNLIDISILTNRSDAMCYEIMAKELAAYFLVENSEQLIKENKSSFETKINIEKFNNCLFNGAQIKYENEKISLEDYYFLQKNNIKIQDDISNILSLIQLYSGISFRVFDLAKIKNQNLKIKQEDKKTYICSDDNKILALGVITEKDFIVNKNTKDFVVEFSSLDTKLVRQNSRALKITNSSSINCSRFISNGSLEKAKKYLFSYFKNHSNTINEIKKNKIAINFDLNYLTKYVGYDISKDNHYKNAIKSLKILGFEFKENKVFVPLYRHDVLTMQDMVEEILRFYNLNNIKEIKPKLNFTKVVNNIDYATSLYALGYYKFNSYTLVSKNLSEFDPFKFNKNISLLTYTSSDHSYIRKSIAVSLLKIYNENLKRKMCGYDFFDQGFINKEQAICLASDQKTYQQIILDMQSIFNIDFEIKKFSHKNLHPNYSAYIYSNNQLIGWVGKFHPKLVDNSPIFIEILIDKIAKPSNIFSSYSSLPLKKRDITFSIKENDSIKEKINELKNFKGIYEIKQKEIFKKDNILKISFSVYIEEEFIDKFDRKFNSES